MRVRDEARDVLAHRRFDLVVADYHLPGIAGLDLLAAIAGRPPARRFRKREATETDDDRAFSDRP